MVLPEASHTTDFGSQLCVTKVNWKANQPSHLAELIHFPKVLRQPLEAVVQSELDDARRIESP